MLIKYIGGRSRFEVSLNRKPYYFTPENNKTVNIEDQAVINYIFGLPNRQEFTVVDEPLPTPEPKVEIKEVKPKKFKKGGK